jgi:O-antigen ligase
MPRELKLIGLGLLLYFLVMSLSVWLDGGKFSEIDRASKALMAAAILPLVACMPVRLNILLSGCGIGAILAFAIAIHDKFFLAYERAFGDVMPIQSGNIAMSLGLFCLCGLLWAQKKGKLAFALFMLVGTCAGMGASFLSGSRGGWVMSEYGPIERACILSSTMWPSLRKYVIPTVAGWSNISPVSPS